MYQLANHVTTLKTKQGYPFILRMLQDMATMQHYYVRAGDSAIVVLVICFFSTLCRLYGLWVGFRSGVCTAIFPSMIPAPILALPYICHYQFVMSSKGCGNTIVWAILQDSLPNEPPCFTLVYLDVRTLERCVVIMYINGCVLAKVNEAKHGILQVIKILWSPSDLLKQHICLNMQSELHFKPAFTGTKCNSSIKKTLISGSGAAKLKQGIWLPHWTTLEYASKACCIILHGSYEMQYNWSKLHRAV